MSSGSPYSKAFIESHSSVWLNTAHQGALPLSAARAAHDAVADKTSPERIREDSFQEVPQRLRAAVGALIKVCANDVILGNSTTYGLELVARGIEWRAGDDVLLADGDFPATIFPWLRLREHGVSIRFLKPAVPGQISAEDVAAHLTRSTRVFCASWVNSFTGFALDLVAIGRVCRAANVKFVVNASQALGALTFDINQTPVDAVTCCGYKWLCGPYGTGFCWIDPSFRQSLRSPHDYWLAMLAGRSLEAVREYVVRDDIGARAFDSFCAANFFSSRSWTESLALFLSSDPEAIARYDRMLVQYLLDRIDLTRWGLISPRDERSRSSLVVIRPRDGSDVHTAHKILEMHQVFVAVREGNLRISPHLYNSTADLDRLLEVLK